MVRIFLMGIIIMSSKAGCRAHYNPPPRILFGLLIS
jgi:hypothetical protein